METSASPIYRVPIDCPVCGSARYTDAYQSEFRVWRSGTPYTWAAHQVVCKDCGMVYTNPQPTSEVLTWFYETDLRLGDSSPYFREQQVKFLKEKIPGENRTLLDVGAYDGDLLFMASKQGFTVFGVEPAAEAVALAKKKYGLDLYCSFLDEAFVSGHTRQYDVVSIRHTLEHVPDPVTFLQLALRLTKPGGYMYIEIPDASRPFAESAADFFSNQHLLHFTPQALANLAHILKVEIVTVELVSEPPIQRMLLRNVPATGVLTNEYEANRTVMEQYKERRARFWKQLAKRIPPDTKAVVIYGAGMHTTQLLQSGILRNVTVEAIVDTNPKKWGLAFEGLAISSPEVLAGTTTPVVISSYDNQEDIARYLTEHYPSHPQIKLYDRVISYDLGFGS